MSATFPRVLGFLLALHLITPAVAQKPDHSGLFGLSRDFVQLTEKQTKAVVRVGKGYTGVIVDGRGYVLTEARAVKVAFRESDRVAIETASGHRYQARPIARSATSRTAIVRIVKGGRYPSIAAGDSDALRVGELAMTIGNAFGQASRGGQASLTVGHVAGLFPNPNADANVQIARIITTAAVNPGSTGGPLIDVRGMLIGIIDPKRGDGDMGQVMPINFIRETYSGNDEAYRVLGFHGGRRSARRYASMIQECVIEAARSAAPAVVSLIVTRKKPAPKPKAEEKDDADKKKDEKKKAPEADLPPKGQRRDGQTSLRPKPKSAPKKNAKPKKKPKKNKKQRPNPSRVAQTRRRSGPVSGVVVTPSGWIATASTHLGKDVEKIEVVLSGGRTLPAKPGGVDEATGLALVKVDATNLPTLPIAPQGEPRVGSFVVALGNPYGKKRVRGEPFLTFGVLSARNQLDAGRAAAQTDAWINQANQGGALVDLDGRLIGIPVLYRATRFGLNSGIGFAIPMESLSPVLDRLQRGQTIGPGYLGLRLIPYAEPGQPGVLIDSVVKKSPAHRAGVRAGDRLIDVNGVPAKNSRQVLFGLAGLRDGDRAQLNVLRQGESKLIAVVAAKRG